MTSDRLRTLVKKFAPYILGGAVLGGAGVAVKQYLAGDCCTAGSSCCHPGSPCCHHHGDSGSVAQR
jgi:hypothetical protein